MCQLLHSDSCSFLIPLLLVRGTAGPSRRQSSWPHIHEYVLRTAWPPDNRCETVQRESSFGSHSCHPATGRLWVWEEPREWTQGWLQERPTLMLSCSPGLEGSRQASICCLSGTPALEAALVAWYSYCASPRSFCVALALCRLPWYLTSLVWGSKSKLLS